MRISVRMQNMIKESIFKSFGDVSVYLFGSRADNTKKGGDIDLAIDCNISNEEFKKSKIKFITTMIRLGFDFKIDLVKYNQDDSLLNNEIQNNSIKLV